MSSVQGAKLILASGSPRRAQILTDAGVPFEVVPANIDEDSVLSSGRSIIAAVQELAQAKALAVAESNPNKFVLGADTVVVDENEILGKPESAADAIEMLERLNARTHEVITGVAVVDPDGESRISCVRTEVTFRKLSKAAIEEYVASGSPFDKAGGYGIQDSSFDPVESYDGCYLNVVGLPMCTTADLLIDSGLSLASDLVCEGHAGASSDQTKPGVIS